MDVANRRIWQRNNKDKYKIQYKARHRANEVYKKAESCSIIGCEKIGQRHHPDYSKPEIIVWLCESHHKQIHRKYNGCDVDNCENKHHAKGKCKLHYNRWKRTDKNYYKNELERNNTHRNNKVAPINS